ncbi:MAG: DUF4397 domain-containing protein [Thermoleophilaceae bacterium]|nr:DUF4397 domain-containing protein [Thermoleophilaceae bacterium]
MPPSWRRALPLAGAVLCIAAMPPAAQGHGAENGKVLTRARFLHAVPMAAPATLIVHGHPPRIRSSYGRPSEYFDCHPGPARVELRVEGRSKPAATAELDIGRGRYTVIAVPEGRRVGLRVYKDGGAVPGKARMRTINAASELGSAEMNVDGRPVARIRPDRATSYASVPPGRHDLSITRPDGKGGAIVAKRDAALVAGTASTAIVVGSGGEPTDMVLVSDQTAGPSVAPATGFVGDVGEETPWLLVALSALLAGGLGGSAYLLAARRRPPLPAAGLPDLAPPREPEPAPVRPAGGEAEQPRRRPVALKRRRG